MLFKKKVPAAAGCFQYQYTTEKRPCTAGVCGADRRPSRMVVLSDLHNSEFGAYNSELVDKVRRRWPAFTCASRWAMWKPDCAPTIWIPPIRRSSTGRRHREHFQRGTLHDPTAVRGQGPEQGRSGSAEENPRPCCPSPQRHDVLRCSAQKRRCLRRRSGQVRLAHLPPQAGGAVRRGKDQVPVKGILAGGVQLHRQSVRRSWCGRGKSVARMPTAVQVSGTSAAR